MATKPLNKNETPATMDDVTDEAQLTEYHENSVATVVSHSTNVGCVDGDVSADDFRLARLQMAYGVGALSEHFNPGALVLGGDNLLAEKGEPIKVIIVQATVYWKEYTSGKKYVAGGPPPQCFRTEAEVIANGGTTKWTENPATGEKTGPTYNKAMNLKLLIQKPAKVICSLFGVEIGGNVYAPAVWDVDKSAYRRVQPVVITAAKFALKTQGLLSGMFEIKTRTEKIGDNLTPVPSIKLIDDRNDSESIAQILELFSADAITEPETLEPLPF